MKIRQSHPLPRQSRLSGSAITNVLAAAAFIAGLGGCAATSPELPPRPAPTSTTLRPAPSSTAPPNRVATSASPTDAGLFFHPDIGQCIDVRKDRGIVPESIVPCSEVHDDEAYAKFTLHGSEYPGETVIDVLSSDGCRARFADFIGIPYENSVFEFLAIRPSSDSWDVHGDRRVTCLVWYPEDSVIGSLEDAGY